MDYGRIISRGWQIVWQNKFMLLLGFLAALAMGGSGGSPNFSFSGDQFNADNFAGGQLPTFVQEGPVADFLNNPTNEQLSVLIGALVAGFILLCCLLFILWIVFWFIGNTARAGMIHATATIEGGQETNFRQSFREGWSHIWRILGLKLTIFVGVALVVLVAFGIPLAFLIPMASGSDGNAGGAWALFGVCMCFLVILGVLFWLAVSFVDAMAYRGIVLHRMGVFESIRHGWAVAKENFLNIFLLGIIFWVISLGVAVVTFAVMVPVGAIVGFSAFDAIMDGTFSTANGVLIAISLLLFIIVAAVVQAALVAWQSSSFTLADLEFTGASPVGMEKEKGPDDLKTA